MSPKELEEKAEINDSEYSDAEESDYEEENEEENEENEEDEDNEEDDEEEEEEDNDEEEEDEEDDDGDNEDDESTAEQLTKTKKKAKRKPKMSKEPLDEDEFDPETEPLYDEEENSVLNEEDEDDLYQKFENYSVLEDLEEKHPEIRSANMDEIKVLSKVVRNEEGIIVDPFHTTAPFLTKYEKARVIGTRAEQIERGAPPFIKDLDENIIHGRTIAIQEFEKKLIPFIIARPLPNQGVEYWKLQDLEVIS